MPAIPEQLTSIVCPRNGGINDSSAGLASVWLIGGLIRKMLLGRDAPRPRFC